MTQSIRRRHRVSIKARRRAIAERKQKQIVEAQRIQKIIDGAFASLETMFDAQIGHLETMAMADSIEKLADTPFNPKKRKR